LTPLLQDVLQNEIKPQQILGQVTRHTVLFKSLRPEQMLLVQNATTDGYTEFDITLLYTLLRNLKCIKVTAPTHGWGTSQMPGNGETTLGDDIERIRLIRNNLLGHAVTPSLSELEYKETNDIISDICRRMDSLFNKVNNKYIDRLMVTESQSIDKEMENTYLDKIKDLCAAEKSTRELLQDTINNTGKLHLKEACIL
jgi:hypothetical protein